MYYVPMYLCTKGLEKPRISGTPKETFRGTEEDVRKYRRRRLSEAPMKAFGSTGEGGYRGSRAYLGVFENL